MTTVVSAPRKDSVAATRSSLGSGGRMAPMMMVGTMSAASSSRQNWHRRLPSRGALRSRVVFLLTKSGSSISISMTAPVLAGRPFGCCVFNHCVNGTSSAARIDARFAAGRKWERELL